MIIRKHSPLWTVNSLLVKQHLAKTKKKSNLIVYIFNGSSTTNTLFVWKLDYRTIAYSVSKTRFFVGKPPFVPVSRELPITNTFSFTMIIYDAAFPPEVENVFSVSIGFFNN